MYVGRTVLFLQRTFLTLLYKLEPVVRVHADARWLLHYSM
jgi:hypothetical protein